MVQQPGAGHAVPVSSQVSLSIINVLGQRVRTVIDKQLAAGSYTLEWDGRDEVGQAVSTGVYFYRLEAGEYVATRKMLLLK